jgi:hypothetical protein
MDMVKTLLKHGAQSDLRVKNKVYLTPVDYTFKNSPEREFLFEVDPSLREFVAKEEADAAGDDDDQKVNDFKQD